MRNRSVVSLLLLLSIFACRDPFAPEVHAQFKNLLVVEGYLNIGGSSSFVLSRTGDLKDWRARIPEANAEIQIEDDVGTLVKGTSDNVGGCVLPTTSLNIGKSYRINIRTADGKVYQTPFLEGKETPLIDSISRKVENDGFKLYVNTHDSSNQTRFYSWDWQETWEIATPIVSLLEYKNGKIVERDQSINISRCWQGTSSSEILLSSTERYSEDKVSEAPIEFVKGNSLKLDQLYSIQVRQYALTREAYHYLENLKRNTEKIGSIFDAQPSELRGNLSCESYSEEQVIGWISAGTVTEKRIFIYRREKLPGWSYRREICAIKDVPSDSLAIYSMMGYLINDWNFHSPPNVFFMAKADCIDCRLQGTNIKPAYWPE